MKLLEEAAAGTLLRLDDVEASATMLLSELDSLGVRLQRGFAAVCIDSCVAGLSAERNRMLEEEKRAETAAGLAKLPALGIYGLVSFAVSRRPDWRAAASSILREEPFGDIRVMVSNDGIAVMNVSRIARKRSMTAGEVAACAEQQGYQVFSWLAFEAKTQNLRTAALRGEAVNLGLEEASSADIEALATSPGT